MKALKFKNIRVASLCFVLGCMGIINLIPGISINQVMATEVDTTRVPALREKVYSQLARAQKLADDGNVAAGIEALDNIKRKTSSMNGYEIAMLHNFYGFIYYNQSRLKDAMNAFEQVVAIQEIPATLKLNTYFSLAQLAMADNQYKKVINYLDRWHAVNLIVNKNKAVDDKFYVLKSQAYYQDKAFPEALKHISIVINSTEKQGKIPKENWLVLQRALFYSLGQPNLVVEVLEKMVQYYNKPAYWLQLANMYGEVGDQNKQLALMETAKQQGFIQTKSELRNLAQVYLYNGLGYKAAETIKLAMKKGLIIEDEENLAFLAESFLMAKEDQKAIPYFAKASKVVSHGNYAQRLAEIYLNVEMYEEAADAAREALDKGTLKSESNAFIALGMAQFNLENFDASILAFEQAEKHLKAKKLASQWIKYVKREQLSANVLKTAYL